MQNSIKTIIKLHEINKRNLLPVIPYQRPKGPKITVDGEGKKFTKEQFKYLQMYDYYVCPNDRMLLYKGVNSNGYYQYRTKKKDCVDCPFKYKYTHMILNCCRFILMNILDKLLKTSGYQTLAGHIFKTKVIG